MAHLLNNLNQRIKIFDEESVNITLPKAKKLIQKGMAFLNKQPANTKELYDDVFDLYSEYKTNKSDEGTTRDTYDIIRYYLTSDNEEFVKVKAPVKKKGKKISVKPSFVKKRIAKNYVLLKGIHKKVQTLKSLIASYEKKIKKLSDDPTSKKKDIKSNMSKLQTSKNKRVTATKKFYKIKELIEADEKLLSDQVDEPVFNKPSYEDKKKDFQKLVKSHEKHVKGSQAAKNHMALLRSMRKVSTYRKSKSGLTEKKIQALLEKRKKSMPTSQKKVYFGDDKECN